MTEHLTYTEYRILAKQILYKILSRSEAIRIIRDDDTFGSIISALMLADVNYNPDKNTKLSYYRILCVRWTILNRYKQKVKIPTVQFDNLDNISVVSNNIAHENVEYINNLINKAKLTNHQKQCLLLYFYKNKTHKEIGNLLGFTKQAAYASIKNGLKKLRNAAKI